MPTVKKKEPKQSEPKKVSQSNYNMTEATLWDDSHKFKVIYPQIEGLSDKEIEQKANLQIKNTAKSVFDGMTSFEDRTITSNYKVMLQNDQKISILFEFQTFQTLQAHPLIWNETVTLDLRTGNRLSLKDSITVNQKLVDAFFTVFHNVTPYDSNEKETQAAVKKYVEEHLKVEDLVTCDSLDNAEYHSYLTKDSVGISIYVPYAIGSIARFEAKNSALSQE